MRLNLKSATFLTLACTLTVACASKAPEAGLSEHDTLTKISDVSDVSCPAGTDYLIPEKIDLISSPLNWMKKDTQSEKTYFAPLKPRALIELNSSDARLGGLSGVDFLDTDTLIMVSDFGSLVWIDLDADTLSLSKSAYITSLKDASGQILDGKTETDAEGITWTGETLFVSMERDHRVLGYDIEGCGANARGALVAAFAPDGFGIGRSIEENSGIEALTSRGKTELWLGLESRVGGKSPVAQMREGQTEILFSHTLKAPEITMLTDLDYVPGADGAGRLYSIHRSYDPLRGNRISLAVTDVSGTGEFGKTTELKRFGSEVMVDNFEGIAVQTLSDTTDRIIIVSDNNFSARQRTLLAVFDYDY